MPKPFQLDEKTAKTARKLLRNAASILAHHGVNYWLEGGTLLGIVRENRLLPWDHDLDISVKEEEVDKLQGALDDLKKIGYRIRLRLFTPGNAPFATGAIRMAKVRTRKFFFLRGKLCLDIFVKYRYQDEYLWQIGDKGRETLKSVPAHLYDGFIDHEFDGYSYRIPAAWDEYLTYRYGNWHIPVREWNPFRDDLAVKGGAL